MWYGWKDTGSMGGGEDVLHQRLEANPDIQAGEVVLELEPGGGDLIDETAKLPTLGVDDLRGVVVFVVKPLGVTLSSEGITKLPAVRLLGLISS